MYRAGIEGSPENGGASPVQGAHEDTEVLIERHQDAVSFHDTEILEAAKREWNAKTWQYEGMPEVMVNMHRQAFQKHESALVELGAAEWIADRPEEMTQERTVAVPTSAMPEFALSPAAA